MTSINNCCFNLEKRWPMNFYMGRHYCDQRACGLSVFHGALLREWTTITGQAGQLYFLPKSISNTVPKIKEILLILDHQISGVKVNISLSKNITKQLLFCVLLVPSITKERILGIHLRNEKARFSCERKAFFSDLITANCTHHACV